MRIWALVAAVGASVSASGANAAVTYVFNGGFAANGYDSPFFSLTLSSYITANTFLSASAFSSCFGGAVGASVRTCTGVDFLTDGLSDTSNRLVLHTSTGTIQADFGSAGTFSKNGTVTGGFLVFATSPSSITVSGFADRSAAPEPASWAMMVGGFAMIGGAMRSRRSVRVAFA